MVNTISKLPVTGIVAVCVAACIFSCKLGTNNEEEETTGVSAAADLRLTNEVSGWTEDASKYVEYDYEALYGIINGGAVPYEDHGMIEGILQEIGGLVIGSARNYHPIRAANSRSQDLVTIGSGIYEAAGIAGIIYEHHGAPGIILKNIQPPGC